MKRLELVMQRRACERIPVNISVRLVLGNMFYAGEITNISETGVFIQTVLTPPPQAMFTILVQNGNSLLQFFARVKWINGSNGLTKGMGSEILNPSTNYLNYANGQ